MNGSSELRREAWEIDMAWRLFFECRGLQPPGGRRLLEGNLTILLVPLVHLYAVLIRLVPTPAFLQIILVSLIQWRKNVK